MQDLWLPEGSFNDFDVICLLCTKDDCEHD